VIYEKRDDYTFSTHFIRSCFQVSEAALALEKEVAQGDQQTSGVESGMALRIIGLLKYTGAGSCFADAGEVEMMNDREISHRIAVALTSPAHMI